MTRKASLPAACKRLFLGWRYKEDGRSHKGDKFSALYVAGPKEIVARRIGDNRGARPIKVGVVESWKDEITRKLDAASPLWWNGVLFRVWCPSRRHADKLMRVIMEELEDHSDPLRKEWLDLGPQLNTQALESAIRLKAKDVGISTWNDVELVEHLKELSRREVSFFKPKR